LQFENKTFYFFLRNVVSRARIEITNAHVEITSTRVEITSTRVEITGTRVWFTLRIRSRREVLGVL